MQIQDRREPSERAVADERDIAVDPNEAQMPHVLCDERRNMAPFLVVSRADHPSPDLFAPIVVLGDSFIDGIVRSGFMEYFGTVYRAEMGRTANVRIPDLLDRLPPDCRYLMHEFIENAEGMIIDLSNIGPRK